MSSNTEIPEDDEYEDWQWEYSGEKAVDFVDNILLEELDAFENDEEDEDYISGIATWGLFQSLIPRLIEMGHSEEDLINEIKTYSGYDPSTTSIH